MQRVTLSIDDDLMSQRSVPADAPACRFRPNPRGGNSSTEVRLMAWFTTSIVRSWHFPDMWGCLLLGLTTLCLGACSSNGPPLYRSSNQQKTIGNGLAVEISNVATEAEALPFADQYCKARGRTPKFSRMEQVSYHKIETTSALFDCLSQSN